MSNERRLCFQPSVPNEWKFCCLMLEKPKKVFSSAHVHNYMGLSFLDQFEQQYLYVIFFFCCNGLSLLPFLLGFSETDYLGKIRLPKRMLSCITISYDLTWALSLRCRERLPTLNIFRITLQIRNREKLSNNNWGYYSSQHKPIWNPAYCYSLFPFSFSFW